MEDKSIRIMNSIMSMYVQVNSYYLPWKTIEAADEI